MPGTSPGMTELVEPPARPRRDKPLGKTPHCVDTHGEADKEPPLEDAPMRMLNAAIMLSAVLLAQAASAQAPEKTKINVATASLGLPYLPLIIAQQRKYFAD